MKALADRLKELEIVLNDRVHLWLVRAANKIERLQKFEQTRLLRRAIQTIREMREHAGIPHEGLPTDVVLQLLLAFDGVHLELASSQQVKRVLLSAAGVIRDLHIVLHTKTEILGCDLDK